MTRTKKFDISWMQLYRQLLISTCLHVIYFLLLYGGFRINVGWNISPENLFHLLTAHDSTIMEWFPNRGGDLVSVIWGVRVVLIAAGLTILGYFVWYRARLSDQFRFNNKAKFSNALLQEIVLLSIFLVFYLILYFYFKSQANFEDFAHFQIWLTRGG